MKKRHSSCSKYAGYHESSGSNQYYSDDSSASGYSVVEYKDIIDHPNLTASLGEKSTNFKHIKISIKGENNNTKRRIIHRMKVLARETRFRMLNIKNALKNKINKNKPTDISNKTKKPLDTLKSSINGLESAEESLFDNSSGFSQVEPSRLKLYQPEQLLNIIDISKHVFSNSNASEYNENVEVLVGTKNYIAPEIFECKYSGINKMVDPYAADIWSLGILLLALITTHFPWKIAIPEVSHNFREFSISGFSKRCMYFSEMMGSLEVDDDNVEYIIIALASMLNPKTPSRRKIDRVDMPISSSST
ncbi:Serine/threonine-protein kinase HAL5 [Smittium culicis]|uniref:Serine/threonine-protein kinase HAL5 n=1 Tax=Smittium culicis TaxID=133412 RepID=A0A1R1Y325_9FUNG|nr:Serine/threonine-protein kinase HAL5 [Smittium culicis]